MIWLSLYLSSPSIRIGGRGSFICEGNQLSWLGSRREMCNVLCMAIEGGKASLYALVPILAKIVNSPIFLYSNFCSFVSWSWYCVATTRPHLLIVGSDRVFSVNRNILFVVIGLPPSCFLMTHVTESIFLVSFAFLESNEQSFPIRGWCRSLQTMVYSWSSSDIRCCMQIPQRVGNHTNRLVDTWCMLVGIVPVYHWSARFVYLFVDGKPCWVFLRFLISPGFLSIGVRWILSPCR